MKQICRFWIKDIDNQIKIDMPEDAEVLCVQVQYGEPYIWAIVDDDIGPETRTFRIYGTGHKMDANVTDRYIGTFWVGQLVFHLFERIK